LDTGNADFRTSSAPGQISFAAAVGCEGLRSIAARSRCTSRAIYPLIDSTQSICGALLDFAQQCMFADRHSASG